MRPKLQVLVTVLVMVNGGVGRGAFHLVIRWPPSNTAVPAQQRQDAGDLRGQQFDLRAELRAPPDDLSLHLRMAELQLRLADPGSGEQRNVKPR